MATQKEHHYVPQFFFRNFSHHPDRTTIHVLLTRDTAVKFDVSIKKQGKRHKLYLRQEIEAALSQVEAGMSSCFRSVLRNVANFPALRNSLPIIHQMAGAFLLQAGRVPARGRRYHDAVSPLFEQLAYGQLLADGQTPPDLREELARGDLHIGYDYRYDVLSATHLALIAPILFFDMTMALLINATPVPFVFSDGPAICTNLFLWDSHEIQGITGYGSRGLIAFMPLCESVAMMFFDGGAYELRSPATNPVYLNADADVGLLNAFQALAADDVIYFGNKDAASYVERLHMAHRHADRQAMVVRTAIAEDGRSELVHHYEKVLPLRPDFSFLKLRRTPTDDDLRLPRSATLMATVEGLTQASISRDPAFTQNMFDSAIDESFVRSADLRARS
jgi:hypothetical protein